MFYCKRTEVGVKETSQVSGKFKKGIPRIVPDLRRVYRGDFPSPLFGGVDTDLGSDRSDDTPT